MRIENVLRFTGLLGVAAIAVLSLLPGDARPDLGSYVPGQLNHFLAYVVTASMLASGNRSRTHVINILLGLIAYAGLLEIAQLWIPGRTSRLSDFVVSALGALIGLGFIQFTWGRVAALRKQK
jgi:VanZ family protein